jgi:hypothetical protein
LLAQSQTGTLITEVGLVGAGPFEALSAIKPDIFSELKRVFFIAEGHGRKGERKQGRDAARYIVPKRRVEPGSLVPQTQTNEQTGVNARFSNEVSDALKIVVQGRGRSTFGKMVEGNAYLPHGGFAQERFARAGQERAVGHDVHAISTRRATVKKAADFRVQQRFSHYMEVEQTREAAQLIEYPFEQIAVHEPRRPRRARAKIAGAVADVGDFDIRFSKARKNS